MTTPNFTNSQLGITIRTDHPAFYVNDSSIVFTDGSQQLTAFTGYTETDPVFTSSVAYNITGTQTGQWIRAENMLEKADTDATLQTATTALIGYVMQVGVENNIITSSQGS